MKQLFNVTEASAYLHVSRTTFYKLILRWKLQPKEHCGNISMFAVEDLDLMKKKIAEQAS